MSTSDLVPILPDKNHGPVVGLGIATASIFLAGEMAGSGVLSLSYAVVQTGTNLTTVTKKDISRNITSL